MTIADVFVFWNKKVLSIYSYPPLILETQHLKWSITTLYVSLLYWSLRTSPFFKNFWYDSEEVVTFFNCLGSYAEIIDSHLTLSNYIILLEAGTPDFFVVAVIDDEVKCLLLFFERYELRSSLSRYLNPWEIPLFLWPGVIWVDECMDILKGSSSLPTLCSSPTI